MLDFYQIQLAAQLGLVSWMTLCVFTKEHYLLEHYQDFLNWLEPKCRPLAYVLGACEKCFCGQWAFWTWLLFNDYDLTDRAVFYLQIINHASFICASILFVIISKRIFNQWI